MKKSNILYIIVFLLILTAINLAHNPYRFSIGSIFSLSYKSVNSQISESYTFEDINEVIYFKPIWYWKYIFFTRVEVKFKNGESFSFNGESVGISDVKYARFSMKNEQLVFYRFGGYKIKDTESEQLDIAIKIMDRVKSEIKTKKRTKK